MRTHTHAHTRRGLCCCRERWEAWQTSPPTTQAFLDQQPCWVPEAGQVGPRCVVSGRGAQLEPAHSPCCGPRAGGDEVPTGRVSSGPPDPEQQAEALSGRGNICVIFGDLPPQDAATPCGEKQQVEGAGSGSDQPLAAPVPQPRPAQGAERSRAPGSMEMLGPCSPKGHLPSSFLPPTLS